MHPPWTHLKSWCPFLWADEHMVSLFLPAEHLPTHTELATYGYIGTAVVHVAEYCGCNNLVTGQPVGISIWSTASLQCPPPLPRVCFSFCKKWGGLKVVTLHRMNTGTAAWFTRWVHLNKMSMIFCLYTFLVQRFPHNVLTNVIFFGEIKQLPDSTSPFRTQAARHSGVSQARNIFLTLTCWKTEQVLRS